MAAIRFTKPTLTRKDMDAVLQTMVDEKIGPGDRRREFIKLFSSYVSARDGAAMRTFVDAIEIALRSIGLAEGESVVVSIYSPDVYETALKALGLKEIIVDVDKLGFPDPEAVKNAVDAGAKAVLFFEPLGQLYDDVERYREFGVPVIEDVTESFGSVFGEAKAGMLGDVVVCAFEEEGVVSTAGGAAVVSGKEEIVENIRKLSERTGRYTELADLNAALGIVQLNKLEATLARRNEIFRAFLQSLNQGEGKMFLSGNIDFRTNGYAFPVIVNSRTQEAVEFARKYGVTVRKSFSGAIGARYQDRIDRYPNAVAALSRCLSFPIYPFLKSVDVDTIQKVLRHIG